MDKPPTNSCRIFFHQQYPTNIDVENHGTFPIYREFSERETMAFPHVFVCFCVFTWGGWLIFHY